MEKLTEKYLRELYIEKEMSMQSIANYISETKSYVRWRIKKYNIKPRTRLIKEVELTKDQLYSMYVLEGKSQREIAKYIGKSQTFVKTKLKEFNINSRESGIAQALKRGIQFNEKFFDYWSKDMSYVLGLMYADGNLFNYRIRLQLHEKDKELIQKVMFTMDIPEKHLFTRTDKKFKTNSCGFSVSRRYTARRLVDLGIEPNKSKTMKFPEIPYKFLRDFLRGYFDGDGSICVSNNQLCLQFSCGSLEFIKELSYILSKVLDWNVKHHTDRRNGNYFISVHSTRLSKSFYNYIYYRDCLCMKRKRLVFENNMPISCS